MFFMRQLKELQSENKRLIDKNRELSSENKTLKAQMSGERVCDLYCYKCKNSYGVEMVGSYGHLAFMDGYCLLDVKCPNFDRIET